MVYPGRAWGSDSRVVFVNTFMDDIVVPEGWGDWGVPASGYLSQLLQYQGTLIGMGFELQDDRDVDLDGWVVPGRSSMRSSTAQVPELILHTGLAGRTT
jgi:hypothetical protein